MLRSEDPVNPIGKYAPGKRHSTAWRMLLWIARAELLGMSLWFAGTAVSSGLAREFVLNHREVAWLTMAVQLGFVVGTLAGADEPAGHRAGATRVHRRLPCRSRGNGERGCARAPTRRRSGGALIAGRFLTGVALACVSARDEDRRGVDDRPPRHGAHSPGLRRLSPDNGQHPIDPAARVDRGMAVGAATPGGGPLLGAIGRAAEKILNICLTDQFGRIYAPG
jgi:hypothetical protein